MAAGCEVIVFLDGDGSDCPELIPLLLQPILAGTHDFVIGSRLRGKREPGSMNATQIVAGRLPGLASTSIRGALHGHVSFPGDSPRPAGGIKFAGKNLWMESGDADAGGQGRFQDLGVAGGSPSPLWGRIKGFRESVGTIKAASRILFTIGPLPWSELSSRRQNNPVA